MVVLESESAIGTGISSRNSEVIHAGIHYETGTLKARFCVEGNAMLRDFAASHNVPIRMLGKLIVAVDADEEKELAELYRLGVANGVLGLELISGRRGRAAGARTRLHQGDLLPQQRHRRYARAHARA